MASGGYRAPGKPAAVSGPGALSQRTDQPTVEQLTALSSGKYGETAQLRSDASGAPVSAGGNHAGNQMLAAALQSPSGFGAPSTMPGVPVTAGADYGPGPDSSALGLDSPDQQDVNNFRRYLPVLIEQASREGTPDSFKQAVRMLAARTR